LPIPLRAAGRIILDSSDIRHKILSAAIILLILVPGIAFGLDARREVLDSGLVLLHSERHNLPIVMVTLLIKASPLDEPPEKAGLANLTAEMLTEGTHGRTSEQISEEIEFIGGGLGASADDDYTMVSLSVLRKDIEKGFEIFADVLLNPSFPAHELSDMKRLVKGDIKQGEEDPGVVAGRAFSRAVYGEHPYGRPVEGTIEGIDAVEREDLVRFHRTYYRPNNSILSVVGDISHDEVMHLIRKYLALWRKGKVPPRRDYSFRETGSPDIIRIDRELTQANIILGHLGIERSNPDYYAVSVMNYILGGGGFSSRLMQIIRDDMGLAYNVYSAFPSGRYRGVFMASVQTRNDAAWTVIGEILKQMRRMREEYVSADELEDAKAYLTGSFPRRLDTMARLSRLLVLVEFYGLGMDYEKSYVDNIRQVTAEDVRRVARKYLHPDRYVLVIVADQKKTGTGGGE